MPILLNKCILFGDHMIAQFLAYYRDPTHRNLVETDMVIWFLNVVTFGLSTVLICNFDWFGAKRYHSNFFAH